MQAGTFYRNIVWYLKGKKEFTKDGYAAASKNFNSDDLEKADIKNKSFMITGSNSGIGKAAAVEIAKRGGKVHMVCRNEERGRAAQQDIITESGSKDVVFHQLDMSMPRSIQRFVQSFLESGEKLDVLINNAGCMVNHRELTEDGLEKNFATNVLGTHVLTTALMPLLQQSKQARVVTVSSGGMLIEGLDPDDLQLEKRAPFFDGIQSYAKNKRQQVVLTENYAKLYPSVHFSCMHPGWADTPAVQTSMPDFYKEHRWSLRTTQQGADTVVWLAISDSALKNNSGLFFQDRKAVSTHLPLARTKYSPQVEAAFMQKMNNFYDQFRI